MAYSSQECRSSGGECALLIPIGHPGICHTTAPLNPYTHHRFPVEIISYGVWLYFRFCLSYRDVEELLFARGIIVTYEAIRKWCLKFGQPYANQLRRRRPVEVLVPPMRLTTTSRLSSGLPRQLAVMWQNMRCSILFHLLVPGGSD